MSPFSQNHQIFVLFLVLTVLTCHVMSRRLSETCTSERHEKWMAQYGKVYKDAAEKDKRFQIFKNNVHFIESFNEAGDKPFNLSINKFADLHNEEFKALLTNGQKKTHKVEIATEALFRYDSVSVTDIPATMDWRKRGAVTPIKDQGTCRSCWAFSTVATIEGLHQIATGELVSLSEQELVDCVKGDSEGCYGGYVEDSFEFITKKGGISSETYYPYKGVNKTCKVKKETHGVARIKGYENVPANSENALLKAVANQPVSAYIEAGGYAFQFYSGGIFTGKCGTHIDHSVTIVGYGKARGGTKYWLVKNSWGTEWGEKGYIRMKRDIRAKEGLCGIATNALYPTA
ncbi:senescence-specific cysteine protease SAG39 [Cajanus cajan]|uniref:Vignain n=1 Tax=Cajanus cajan TaxID=3821 RepID=A0A151TL09_CAJCA|nr:senescence-specific cysteine protease SAG39 [Cajanus cajan]KYP67742.1 Vignain [Cajanus cajan]